MMITEKAKEELISEVKTLQARLSELERSEKECRHFPKTEHRNEAIFVVFDRKLEFINDRFAELFCVSPEDACNDDFNPMTLIAPESRPLVRELYREGSRGTYMMTQSEFTGMCSHGRKIEFDAMVIFIPYKWGTAMQGVLQDISVQTKNDEASLQRRCDFPSAFKAIPASGFYGELQLNAP